MYNPRSLAFAAHYGFRPVACRVRRPQTKGKVERPFSFVETSLLNGRSFGGLGHLNETAAWWLAEVADVRLHRQTEARPLDRHAEERPHLLPLPARPFDTAEVVYRTVDVEGFVVYRQNFYSAPLAADRPDGGGAGDRGRTDDLRPRVRGRGVPSALSPKRRRPAGSPPGP